MPNPNTYTWTCPRCRFAQVSGSPTAPDNCPRCNYPDAPTAPVPNVDAELEADITPGEAMMQLSEEQLERVAAGMPAGLVPNDGGVKIETVGGIDPGWFRTVLEESLAATGYRLGGPKMDPNEDRIANLMAEVIHRYNQPRPVLLCGCVAGTHPDTFSAMQEAHPERKSR
jgi:hypothetical protein